MRSYLLLAAVLLGAGTFIPAQVLGPLKGGEDRPCSTLAAARQITSFDELMEVLKSGGEVRAVFHYARCRLVADGDTTEAPDAVGGMTLGTFEYFAPNSVGNPQAFVSSSQTSLIARRKGHVYKYVKLKIYQDGRAEVTARYLEPPKMKIRMDETFLGRLDDGENQGGINLYQAGCRN
jgi:hypothetical protein